MPHVRISTDNRSDISTYIHAYGQGQPRPASPRDRVRARADAESELDPGLGSLHNVA